MREDLIYAIVRGVLVGALIFVLMEQNNKIAELEDRVQSVENQHTIVLNSCRTTGQVCREILSRLTGGGMNGSEK